MQKTNIFALLQFMVVSRKLKKVQLNLKIVEK